MQCHLVTLHSIASIMHHQVTDYGCLIRAFSKISQMFRPIRQMGRIDFFVIFDCTIQQTFCHCISLIHYLNQSFSTKIKLLRNDFGRKELGIYARLIKHFGKFIFHLWQLRLRDFLYNGFCLHECFSNLIGQNQRKMESKNGIKSSYQISFVRSPCTKLLMQRHP